MVPDGGRGLRCLYGPASASGLTTTPYKNQRYSNHSTIDDGRSLLIEWNIGLVCALAYTINFGDPVKCLLWPMAV